ncbi:MAG: DNA recombination protein RmuC [Patescibacteria group bacterium]|nr:DNA recombination protein RmuC [Patescibacteria group bacterium]
MNELFFISFVILLGGGIVGTFIFLNRKSSSDKTQNESIRDLERRLTDLMIKQMKEVRDSQGGASRALHDQIRSFTKETIQIREGLKQIQEKVQDVSSFQEIFKSPKLRGQWGEASLEHILTQHFPQELWIRQHSFSSGQQVDMALKLPNGKILPIDSKFSSDNFQRMLHSTTDDERSLHEKSFLSDLKLRVDEISSKYVLPSEGTVDFALMYIPAEAIYYEIMFNLREKDVASYAWKNKIILTSPNTIYLTLRTIEHWFRDTQVSKQTQEILKRLSRINQDAGKLMKNFGRLGTHLKNTVSAYDSSEKRLGLFSGRVEKLLDMKKTKKLK